MRIENFFTYFKNQDRKTNFMKILVIGCEGFIGFHLCHKLEKLIKFKPKKNYRYSIGKFV